MSGARKVEELRPRCGRHPGALAGWVCSGCHTRLCPACAATRAAGPTSSYTVCALCGDGAVPIVAPRAVLRPFTERLLPAPSWPLGKSVLASLVALAGFRALLSYRGFAPLQAQAVVAGASVGAFWAYIFYIIRHTASGQRGLGVPEFRDVKEDLFAPATKGAAATALIWVPAVLYLLVSNGWDWQALFAPGNFRDPVIWLLVLLGIAYCPMALVAAATDIELVGMLNPLQIVRYIGKAGRDYLITVAALALLAVPGALISGLIAPLLRGLPIPFFCRWLAEAATLYVPFVMARVLGTLLHVHGDALDWGNASEYEEPVLPDARPRGTAPAPRPRASQPVAPLAPQAAASPMIELPLEESVPTVLAAVGAGEPPLEEPPAAPLTPPTTEIGRALAGQDLPRALSLYEESRQAAQGLAPDEHFAVGQAAANAGRYPLAVRALKVAAYSSHPVAPRALVILARVYGEGLRDPDSAERLFHETVKRYPGTAAAAFAQEQLAQG
jgi:hypothetical protein